MNFVILIPIGYTKKIFMALDLSQISVLLVEDSSPINKMLCDILDRLGFKNIDSTKNGQAAFDVFCEKRHDIAIIDWMMEPVDGLELTQLIRRNSKSPNKLVPIIMLTGYNSFKRVKQARDMGVTEYLVKPFTAQEIADRISYVINNPRDFIHAKNYFGPDRRRLVDISYSGSFRRNTDMHLDYVEKGKRHD
jgi:DNA-binding response OmpR family regulator